MATPRSTSRPAASKSRILAAVPKEEILHPIAKPFEWNGQVYQIFPLPDSALMVIGDTLGRTGSVLDGIAQNLLGDKGGKALEPTDLLPLLPAVPQILAALVPCQSKLVAASLRLDEKIVADEMPLVKKVEALRLILEAENLPLLIAHFGSLIGAFRRSETATTEG